MSELTPKQERFCLEYLKDLNGKQSAIRAGYSKKTANEQASRLLTNVNVRAFIDSKKAKVEEKTLITVERVVTNLVEIEERCRQAVPVMERGPDGKMVESGEFKFDSAGALKANELLGKHLKMYTDKLDLGGKISLEQLLDGSWDKKSQGTNTPEGK